MNSELEIYQRGLLDLIKGRGQTPEHPYLQALVDSRELVLLREIALWWRVLLIEKQSRLVSCLLKRLGSFEEAVQTYFRNNPTSPFIEELNYGFLKWLGGYPDSLVRSVSGFEYALLKVLSGSNMRFEILWDRNPELVLRALDNGNEVPPLELGVAYRMEIARGLPGLASCTREVT